MAEPAPDDPPWVLNVKFDEAVKQACTNAARGFQQCVPHMKSDGQLILLAGGPSLNDYAEEILKKKLHVGTPIICTNNTYNWCVERGILPDGLVICDAQPHNIRFLENIQPNCKVFLASQCHPSLFDVVPESQIWIWHSQSSKAFEETLDEIYGDEQWYPVSGGTTVTLRAIMLLQMLGWHDLEIYGFDGCMQGEIHHAYDQPENDDEKLVDVTVGDRVFKCQRWMAVQALDFQYQYRAIHKDVKLRVHGDGLIAHYLRCVQKTPRKLTEGDLVTWQKQ